MATSGNFAIGDYKRIVILTGAGISVASGIAPFRGPGGLWTDHDIERCATAQALAKTPEVVWEAFAELRRKSAITEPNAAHFAMAGLEQRQPSTVILTQNIDGLHQKAGSKQVLELHGNIHRSRCTHCQRSAFTDNNPEYRKCDKCGAPLRYDIVLFNENLNHEVMRRTEAALLSCDLLIAAGTSGLVYPAAGFAQLAKSIGAYTVLVNLEPVHSHVYDKQVIGKAEEVMPELLDIQTTK